jgi:hypothetical protein
MANLRADSLCRTCSGRGEQFFFQNKAYIDQQACSVILDRCAISFESMVNFIKELDKFLDGLNELLHPRCAVFIGELYKMKKISQALFDNNIFKMIADLVNKEKQVDEQQLLDTKNEVCEKLVTIGHETFIEQVSAVLSSCTSMLTGLRELLTSIMNNNFELPSTSSSPSSPLPNQPPSSPNESRQLTQTTEWSLPSTAGSYTEPNRDSSVPAAEGLVKKRIELPSRQAGTFGHHLIWR